MACIKKLWIKQHGSFTPHTGEMEESKASMYKRFNDERKIQRREAVAATLKENVPEEKLSIKASPTVVEKRAHQSQHKAPSYLEELKQKQNALREKKLKLEQNSISETPSNNDYQVITFHSNQNSIPKKDEQSKTDSIIPEVTSTLQKTAPEAPEKALPSPTEKTISFSDTSKTHKKTKDLKTQGIKHTDTNTPTQKKLANEQHRKSKKKDTHIDDKKQSEEFKRDSGVEEVIDDGTTFEEPPRTSTSEIGRLGILVNRPELANSTGVDEPIKTYEKDERTRQLIKRAIEANDFLNNYMDDERKKWVINAMEPVCYPEGSYIIREKEEGSELYVSEEGHFDVMKNGTIINSLGPGCVFGELAILYDAKRFASIVASTNAKVWKINREKFRIIMIWKGNKEREENLNFLTAVPVLKTVPEESLVKIVELLKRVFYSSHTRILKQGDTGNDFFIIRGGTVTIKKTNEYGEEIIVGTRGRGDYFGERALLHKDCRQASVYADPPGTECVTLDREAFIKYLGEIDDVRNPPPPPPQEIPRYSGYARAYEHINLKDLEKVGILGCGGFGRVELVQYKKKETYALKILKKIEVVQQQQTVHVYSEKMVMALCHSDFIVKLYKTFRDAKYVYFLMEACLGGDVFSILQQRKYFDNETARFFVGCVVEAFDYLHKRNIVYRDLKPENMMVMPDGYCKLVDFGFAKILSPSAKTNTFAGTPEYVAPEIVTDRGHDKGADYWALGILIHELLSGAPPFRGRDQIRIYQQIITGIDFIRMPTRISQHAQRLIKNLCRQNPAERMGCQKKGISEIRNHSWFSGFNWEQLQKRKMSAPIKRPVRNNTDLKYFTVPREEEDDNVQDETSGWDRDF